MKYIRVAMLVALALRLLFAYSSSEYFSKGTKVRLSSRVNSEPVRYEDSQYLRLEGLRIYLPLYPEISYGDFVTIEGVVASGKDGVVNKLGNPKLVSVSENSNFLYKFRNKILAFFNKSLPVQHSALIAGMVLGSKKGLTQDLYKTLKSTGTIHVVVASGMNATLVGGFILSILINFIERKKAVFVSVIFVWIYALVSGFDAPIIRASFMISIASFAQITGKLNSVTRSLFLSAIVMLLVKPLWLTDLGFILSFVSTASLMLFGKRLSNYLKWVPSLFREGLSTSLAAQIGVAPIIFVTFGQFNIFSPLINALVLWTVPFITIVGFISAICSLIWFDLGKANLYLVYPFTSWFLGIVSLSSNF